MGCRKHSCFRFTGNICESMRTHSYPENIEEWHHTVCNTATDWCWGQWCRWCWELLQSGCWYVFCFLTSLTFPNRFLIPLTVLEHILKQFEAISKAGAVFSRLFWTQGKFSLNPLCTPRVLSLYSEIPIPSRMSSSRNCGRVKRLICVAHVLSRDNSCLNFFNGAVCFGAEEVWLLP